MHVCSNINTLKEEMTEQQCQAGEVQGKKIGAGVKRLIVKKLILIKQKD